MPEKEKKVFTSDDYLTVVKFAEKYRKTKELTQKAFDALFKRNKLARDERGRLQQVVYRNKPAHSTRSLLKAHPLFHDIILNEIEKQAIITQKHSQGATK